MPSWLIPFLIQFLPQLPSLITGIKGAIEAHPTAALNEEQLAQHKEALAVVGKLHEALTA